MADLSGSHTLEIDAPIERCFEIAADVERAPEWQGSMVYAEALERDAEGRATLVETQVDASVTKQTIVVRFSYDEPHGMRWSRERGDLKSLDGSWAFEDLGGGRTRATYSLAIGLNRALSLLVRTLKGPVEQRVRELLANRPVEGLKQRAESAD